MSKCWRFSGKDTHSATVDFEYFACGNTAEYRTNSAGNLVPYVDGKSAVSGSYSYRPGTESLSQVSSVVRNPNIISGGNCTNCTGSVPSKYDCINGACIESSQYKTPGIYDSLSICETACGTGCSGKCISNSEWNQIEQLANQIRQRNCS